MEGEIKINNEKIQSGYYISYLVPFLFSIISCSCIGEILFYVIGGKLQKLILYGRSRTLHLADYEMKMALFFTEDTKNFTSTYFFCCDVNY